MKDRYIEFGEIVSTHGLKGELKIYPHTNRDAIILKLKKVYIDNVEYKVKLIRKLNNMFGIKLETIDNIEDASNLLNKTIQRKIDNNEIELSSKQNEYFIKDLKDMDVYDDKDSYLGKLTEVFETGANDVYKIVTTEGKEVLLPAIKQVVVDVNLKAKKMKVKILEGLI